MLSLPKHLGRFAGFNNPTALARCFDKLSMTDALITVIYLVMSATSSSLSGFTLEG